MSIITITTDAYSNGRALAESVAQKMGYACIGDEMVSSASETYEVAESKLIQASRTSPSFIDRLFSRRHRCIAYLEAVLTEKMLSQDIVYHGLIGIPRIQQVSHAFKVRVVANLEDRIPVAIKKEKLSGKTEAGDRIFKEDEERKQWARGIYGMDISDSSLYDLVVNIGHMGAEDAEDAVETIASTAKHKKFQPMTYSLNCMNNIALSCKIKAAFIDIDPKMEIKSEKGTVYVFTGAFKRKKQDRLIDFKQEIMKLEGVEHVEVYVEKEIFNSKARGH